MFPTRHLINSSKHSEGNEAACLLLYAEVALTMVPKKQTSEMLSECNFGLKIYLTDVPVDAELSSNTSEGSVKPISVCILRDKLL